MRVHIALICKNAEIFLVKVVLELAKISVSGLYFEASLYSFISSSCFWSSVFEVFLYFFGVLDLSALAKAADKSIDVWSCFS